MSIVNGTNDDASAAILELFPRQGEWRDGEYLEVIQSGSTEHALSRVLPGFRIDVGQIFHQAQPH